jgi:2-oxoglutarate dehydrogenase E1 component
MTDKLSFIHGSSPEYFEELYEKFKKDPSSLDPSWQKFFAGYEFAIGVIKNNSLLPKDSIGSSVPVFEALIHAYRASGHIHADLNPLEKRRDLPKELTPEYYKLSLDSEVRGHSFASKETDPKKIIAELEQTYASHIGIEFLDLNHPSMTKWLQEKVETYKAQVDYSKEQRSRILEKLTQAEIFEKFLQTKYLGQKRFSIEGLDALIPLIDALMQQSADDGVEEICIGMAHRGRLNVLANILEKPLEHMLVEFEGSQFNPFDIEGDVKYHLGCASTIKLGGSKSIRMYLSPNPSHLEAVNPVLEGFVRSRQEKQNKKKVLPLLLHGDAAFIGQGVVAETFNLSKLDSYSTGGTIHIVTNNAIGFTANPNESRSCIHCSDISKIVRAPIIHVNADHPEMVVWAAKIAVAFRNKFHEDIVIDLIGYRRHGHNETDEPSFTQPLLYKKIKKHSTVLSLYRQSLVEQAIFTEAEFKQIEETYKKRLNKAYDYVHGKKVKLEKLVFPKEFTRLFTYKKARRAEIIKSYKTSIDTKKLQALGEILLEIPKDFTAHSKIIRLFASRRQMLVDKKIDWSFAELLATASLLSEEFAVRFSGQDSRRGTFSSRHAVVFDVENNKEFNPQEAINPGKCQYINSPLSELSCLGFEFGYSLDAHKSLVVWEAQFGDFVNGAQVVIDQFLVASEAKWQQTSQLVLLLPHGYEGMGPEHSSARPERFLQSCGSLNIQVCNPTTPAQYFHLLRRQMHRSFYKPLVVLSPKSLLRHPKVVSDTKEFCSGSFSELIDDTSIKKADKCKNLILCSGKIYYDLLEVKEQQKNISSVPLVRLEQLYPFPSEKIKTLLKKYKNLSSITWVQEEPKNMGGYNFVLPRIQTILPSKIKFGYVGRKPSGSTAEGSGKSHKLEQQRIVEEAFALVCAWEPKRG